MLWAAKKKKDHSVPSRETNHLFARFSVPETFCAADDPIELSHQADLVVHQQFRISDHVDEQQMRDLEGEFRLILGVYLLLGHESP
ncbi:MAG: hypothetical protein M3505_01630 [Verrucomicrobiota bacterium]|nr:hypothetical protein [Verrucomicrobiota bacterium]